MPFKQLIFLLDLTQYIDMLRHYSFVSKLQNFIPAIVFSVSPVTSLRSTSYTFQRLAHLSFIAIPKSRTSLRMAQARSATRYDILHARAMWRAYRILLPRSYGIIDVNAGAVFRVNRSMTAANHTSLEWSAIS